MADDAPRPIVSEPVEKAAPKYTVTAHRYWMSGIFREVGRFESPDLDLVMRTAKAWIEQEGSKLRLQISVEGPVR